MTRALLSIGLASVVWAQNFGIGTPTPTERLDVEGGRLRVRAYSGAGIRVATVDPNGVFGVIAGSAAGDILQWNGTDWVAAPAPSATAQTQAPLQGNGTAGSPITFQNGTAAGQVWQWDGTQWVLATISGDDWGMQAAVVNAPLTGDGTAANPIGLTPGTAAGEVLTWNGTNWVAAAVPGDNWGTQTAVTSGPITGTGVPGNPITFANGTAAGQVWQWNGTQWVLATISGDNWGTQTAVVNAPLTGDGTAGNPIALQAGGAVPQILLWNPLASQWQITNIPVQNGLNFNLTNPPGNPAIELGGALVRNTDIPLAGFNLTFSGGTGNVGIGTTTPAARLHVNQPNAATAVLVDATSTSSAVAIMQLRSGGTSRFRVNGNGEAIVGNIATAITGDLFTARAYGAFPYAVNGYTTLDGTAVYGARETGASGAWGCVQGEEVSGVANASGVAGLAGTNTQRGVYGEKPPGGSGWGGLFLNDLGYTGFFGVASDSRFKKDIQRVENVLPLLTSLPVYKYHYTSPYLGGDERYYYGFMAQDVEAIFPDLVAEKDFSPGASRAVPVKPEELRMKAVSVISFVPLLIQALKEQQAQIERLEAEVRRLQEELRLQQR